MRIPFGLLKVVGKAVLKCAGAGVPFVDLLPELAREVWRAWSTSTDEGQRRQEVQALAEVPAAHFNEAVSSVVEEIAADHPDAVRHDLAAYLRQMPVSVRRSLRRPSDPRGVTVSRARRLREANDLLPFLPDRMPRFQPGDRPLPGVDWELEELLGIGGFGEVWKARNPHFASVPPVALKFCLDREAQGLLGHEAAMLDRVMSHGKHPGIVRLQHTYVNAEPPCLEYEFIEGGDLAGLIRQWHEDHGGPAPAQARQVMKRLAAAVGHAHRHEIVHRDLKPANVLVQPHGRDGFELKVADFGIGGMAARQAIDRRTRLGSSRGEFVADGLRGAHTALYASPQQINGEAADPRDDVHALGVIWYQLLTGDLARGAPSGRRWEEELRQRGVSPAELSLLASCFDTEASARPRDAQALAERLDRVEEIPVGVVRPVPVRVVSPREHSERRPNPPERRRSRPASWRRAGLIAGGACVAGLVVLVLVLVLTGSGRPAVTGAWRQTEPPTWALLELRGDGTVVETMKSGQVAGTYEVRGGKLMWTMRGGDGRVVTVQADIVSVGPSEMVLRIGAQVFRFTREGGKGA